MKHRHKIAFGFGTLLLIGFLIMTNSSSAVPVGATETVTQGHGFFDDGLGRQLLNLGPLPILFGLVTLAFWVIPHSKLSRE